MNMLVTVECYRPGDDWDDEPLLAITFAESAEDAEELCRERYAELGFSSFESRDLIIGSFPGPDRVLGHAGQKVAFGWK